MKTAIYIEDGVVQLVLTPESEFEKNALGSFEGKEIASQIFVGAFYDCRGGWVKQKHHTPTNSFIHQDQNDQERSLIIRMSDTRRES